MPGFFYLTGIALETIVRNMSNYETYSDYGEMFKALSNPHRLALFKRLMGCCEPGTVCNVEQAARLCVSDLGEGVDIAPSTLSHHLKELHRAGLVKMERKGKNVQCWLEPEILQRLREFFSF